MHVMHHLCFSILIEQIGEKIIINFIRTFMEKKKKTFIRTYYNDHVLISGIKRDVIVFPVYLVL